MSEQTLPQQDDRRLLAAVSKWARTNGWANADWRGWRNARWEDTATIALADNEAGFRVWRKSPDAMFFTGQPTEYPADSVRQAVDMLVALDILPASFASAYRAGIADSVARLGGQQSHVWDADRRDWVPTVDYLLAGTPWGAR